MSNEITLEALLAQNAGETVQNFTPDDRLFHTVENIRNGDDITEELLTDLKNRQDDLNTVLNDRVTELEDIYVFGNNIVNQGYVFVKKSGDSEIRRINATDGHAISSTFGITSLVLEKNGSKLYESRSFGQNLSVQIDLHLFVDKKPYYSHAYIYRGNALETEYQLVKKIEFDSVSQSVLEILVNPSEVISDPSVTYNGRIGFTAPSNYVALQTSRIQVGQLVDGLDALIQANEIDFNNRTEKIIEFTQG